MAELTTKAAAAGNNTLSATQITPIVNSSVVRMTTDSAAQVFNTPELLELILSGLDLPDIFHGASLVCHAFKTSIDSSPTINKRLEFSVIDAMPTELFPEGRNHHYCRLLQRIPLPGLRRFYLVMAFPAVSSIEQHISSPSFRKIRMPEFQLLSGESRETPPTIAERLEKALAYSSTGKPITRTRVILGTKRARELNDSRVRKLDMA